MSAYARISAAAAQAVSVTVAVNQKMTCMAKSKQACAMPSDVNALP